MVDNNKKHCPCEICELCEVDFGNVQHCLGNKCETNIRISERKKTIEEFVKKIDIMRLRKILICVNASYTTFEVASEVVAYMEEIAEQMKGETDGASSTVE